MITSRSMTQSASIYVRPDGCLIGQAAIDAVAAKKAGMIAGGWSAYSLVELLDRNGRHEWLTYEQFSQSRDSELNRQRQNIELAKAPQTPQIMGIVNVTPDSFSDGGDFGNTASAVEHAKLLIGEGADIIDIGGESTRPGARQVSVDEELARVVPVIKAMADAQTLISIDTRKPQIMQAAVSAGANIINDVTALEFSPDSLPMAKQLAVRVVLMHSAGTPETMQDNPDYDNVVLDIYDYLARRIAACKALGIKRSSLIIDPGIGFGKTLKHNLELIDRLAVFHSLGASILLGASRKTFIGKITGESYPKMRDAGSLAVAAKAILQGVQYLRVHNVEQTVQARAILMAYPMKNMGS